MPYWFKPAVTIAKQQVYDGTDWQNQLSDTSGVIFSKVGFDGSDWRGIKIDTDGKVYYSPYTYSAGPETYTSTGTGTEVSMPYGVIALTWQVLSDSSATPHDVRLQGSIDGTNWFDLDKSNTTGNEMRHVINKPVTNIRINVVSMGDASSITVRVFGIR